MDRPVRTTALTALDARLIGPGASPAERVTVYATAAGGCALAAGAAAADRMPGLAVAVVAVVAFDQFGGAVVNATATAKCRFHRPGRTRRHHFAFVAGHVQPFLLALVVPGFGWGAAGLVYGLAICGAALVLAVPAHVRRPVAFAVAVLATGAVAAFATVPAVLQWFAPVLLVKLLPAHLLPEGE